MESQQKQMAEESRKERQIRNSINRRIRVHLNQDLHLNQDKVKEGNLTEVEFNAITVRSLGILLMNVGSIRTKRSQGVIRLRWQEMMMKMYKQCSW